MGALVSKAGNVAMVFEAPVTSIMQHMEAWVGDLRRTFRARKRGKAYFGDDTPYGRVAGTITFDRAANGAGVLATFLIEFSDGIPDNRATHFMSVLCLGIATSEQALVLGEVKRLKGSSTEAIEVEIYL